MKKPLQMKVIATKGTKELLRVDVNFGIGSSEGLWRERP